MIEEKQILDGLNEKQREAVEATEGRIRIIAGAGSGKTKALTRRYAYLVEHLGIGPANILCMTFTNKAAQEMKQRIAAFVREGDYNDFVCTIHGFCVKFLRREIFRLGFPETFSILDEDDQNSIAKQILKEFGVDRSKSTLRKFLVNIEFKKSLSSPYMDRLTYIERFMLKADPGTYEKKDELFVAYLRQQTKLLALDFNDLIHFTILILKRFKEAREYWQNELNYILLDEAQDCNENDWMIVDILSRKHNNLFVVGDPDQAIYEWRGSVPELFNEFKAGRDIIMDENYRSTPQILHVANDIIAHNRFRIEKNLFTRKPDGQKTIHLHAKTEQEESLWIAGRIKNLVKEGASYSDFAVLYRAAFLSRSLEQALLKSDIPYRIWGGIRFFERKEIKDAVAYLKVIANGDDLSFLRIANVPSRKIGKVFLEKLQKLSEGEGIPLYESLKKHLSDPLFNRGTVKDFVGLIEDCRKMSGTSSLSDLLNYALAKSGLMDEIRKDGQEERLENIEELMHSLKNYEKEHAEDTIDLNTYLQDIALYTNAEDKIERRKEVKLMTVHQAKGLEFPYVFVAGLSEGIFPSHKTIRERGEKGEEEERRLIYVAITRAEKMLFLTESEGYNLSTQTDKYPSRFLLEIEKNSLSVEGRIDHHLLEGTARLIRSLNMPEEEKEKGQKTENDFKEGDLVLHQVFGEGSIIKINKSNGVCLVRFEKAERNIRSGFLRLKTD